MSSGADESAARAEHPGLDMSRLLVGHALPWPRRMDMGHYVQRSAAALGMSRGAGSLDVARARCPSSGYDAGPAPTVASSKGSLVSVAPASVPVLPAARVFLPFLR